MSLNVLAPLGPIYSSLMSLRNQLYNKKWVKTHRLNVPVISVGNITVGGTGKTPFVMYLLNHFSKKNHQALVVSRGYGRTSSGIKEVFKTSLASEVGDEPLLIKTYSEKSPVFVGSTRYEAAQRALEKHNVDLVIADDAFQHRQLHRDLDIVLIDSSEPIGHLKVLPAGRLRESLSGLSRANIIIFTKTHLVSADQMSQLKQVLQPFIGEHQSTFHSSFDVRLDANLQTNPSVLLVSGVAQPSSVEESLQGKAKVLKHLIFKDHHEYTPADISLILKEFEATSAQAIICTEKDFVKLKKFIELGNHLTSLQLVIKINEEKLFCETIDQFNI